MPYLTKSCGCEFDVDVYGSYGWGGCCCGECYNSYGYEFEVDDVTVVKLCEQHNKF